MEEACRKDAVCVLWFKDIFELLVLVERTLIKVILFINGEGECFDP